jgi:hypothetical protein
MPGGVVDMEPDQLPEEGHKHPSVPDEEDESAVVRPPEDEEGNFLRGAVPVVERRLPFQGVHSIDYLPLAVAWAPPPPGVKQSHSNHRIFPYRDFLFHN